MVLMGSSTTASASAIWHLALAFEVFSLIRQPRYLERDDALF